MDWLSLYRPSYAGKSRDRRNAERDRLFGSGAWRTAFVWWPHIIQRDLALQLYEDAYLTFLQRNVEDLEWLVRTASDVYDNSPTNVASGLDYGAQENQSSHYQDIALRRSLLRLGRVFEGDHLVEVRGKDSEGFRLNPGLVPFHLPQLIVAPQVRGWWRPGSIEAFWQSNKVLQVRGDSFSAQRPLVVHLALCSAEGRLACLLDSSGYPRALPTLELTGDPLERAWDSFCRERLPDLGAVLSPLAVEPEGRAGTVHVIQAARVWKLSGVTLDFALREQILGAHIEQPARDLLKKALRAEPERFEGEGL